MLALIRSIHAEFKGFLRQPAHGQGVPAARLCGRQARVERLMQENGIQAKHKRRSEVTTDSKHNLPVAPNLLARDFTPEAPGQVWTSDST